MYSILDKLAALKESDPDRYSLLQQLAANARDPNQDARIRLNCAMALGVALTPLMMNSACDDFSEQYATDSATTTKQALETLAPTEPVYEYRYVRGAKVKVRVN